MLLLRRSRRDALSIAPLPDLGDIPREALAVLAGELPAVERRNKSQQNW
jgi:hypothetical protein